MVGSKVRFHITTEMLDLQVTMNHHNANNYENNNSKRLITLYFISRTEVSTGQELKWQN